MQATSRDDFIIAIRSAFLKKENKQKFSLIALILLTIIILVLGRLDFKIVEYLKISLKEVAYRSTFIVSIPENLTKSYYEKTKRHFSVYNENIQLKKAVSNNIAKYKKIVEKNFDYVGDKFTEEAKKMKYGEKEERPIYGEATMEQTKELAEEDINVVPLPWAPTKKTN